MTTDATDLARLHDIMPPPPAPLWPPAPGAAILLLVLAATLLTLLLRSLIRWQRNRYRREALSELRRATHPADIAILLKRTALTAYPRATVAALTGPAWHTFLNRTAATTAFTDAGPLLETAAYNPRNTLTPAQTRNLAATARHWIKKHKTSNRSAPSADQPDPKFRISQ